ncbi:permease [Clostridium grantii]|uniref:Permease n=1 Tax=Clostridium grantii DSM 8605 TaxID=1121316 RepID=A0A1M5XMF0_9CLOT|nr:permease [Clostridium grantii]SHI00832.1 hypothetical protein SAMN02745207_03771 [Clostridium grantii DSM 8605]
MDISTIILYFLAIGLTIFSFIKNPNKTKLGLKKGWMAFKKILPVLIPLFIIVGVLLSLITPHIIKSVLGDDSGFIGIILGVLLGSITFMPPFVAYPLGAELISQGAGYAQIAGFISSVMAVGFVYIPTEIKYFGKKSTILRNILGLIASLIVANIIWVVM